MTVALTVSAWQTCFSAPLIPRTQAILTFVVHWYGITSSRPRIDAHVIA
jgi:hypothetical protein